MTELERLNGMLRDLRWLAEAKALRQSFRKSKPRQVFGSLFQEVVIEWDDAPQVPC